MNRFELHHHLYQVANANHRLIPVLNRFGLRPGFGDTTLEEACRQKNIHPDFLLAVLNTYHNPSWFPKEKLLSIPSGMVIQYLNETHRYYRENILPELGILLDKLLGKAPSELQLIRVFYEKYIREFLQHLREEEELLFPGILAMAAHPESTPAQDVIELMEREHHESEEKLSDLKQLLLRHIPPEYNDRDYFAFVAELFHFEQDVADHSRIEEVILFEPLREKLNRSES